MENNYEEICACEHVHSEVVEKVEVSMPDEETLYEVAELFKVFGDSTRTRIISALFEAELCVCDIAEILGMTKSAVSHQLKILRQAKRLNAKVVDVCDCPYFDESDEECFGIVANDRVHYLACVQEWFANEFFNKIMDNKF